MNSIKRAILLGLVFASMNCYAGLIEFKTQLEPEEIKVSCDVKSKPIKIEVRRPLTDGLSNQLQKRVTDVFSSNYGHSAHQVGAEMLYYVPLQFKSKREFILKFDMSANESGIRLVSTGESSASNQEHLYEEIAKDPIGKEALNIIDSELKTIEDKFKQQLKIIDNEFARFQQGRAFEYPQSYITKMSLVGTGSLYRKVRVSICGERHVFKARVKWKRHKDEEGLPLPETPDWILEKFDEN